MQGRRRRDALVPLPPFLQRVGVAASSGTSCTLDRSAGELELHQPDRGIRFAPSHALDFRSSTVPPVRGRGGGPPREHQSLARARRRTDSAFCSADVTGEPQWSRTGSSPGRFAVPDSVIGRGSGAGVGGRPDSELVAPEGRACSCGAVPPEPVATVPTQPEFRGRAASFA